MTNATTATWGLTGAEFLWLYGGMLALLSMTTAVLLRRAVGPRGRAGDPRDLDLYELALINGGQQLAITAAATTLHREGVLAAGSSDGTHVVDGELDSAAQRLERELFEVVRRNPQISTELLRAELTDGDTLTATSAELMDEGLLADAGRLAWLRALWIPGALLLALGLLRLLTGATNGAPIAYLLVMIAAVFWLIAVALRRRAATRRGRALVAGRRESRRPLRETPPASESALAVALFGGAALWVADPAIAASLRVPREDAALWERRDQSCSSGGGCAGCGGCGCGGCG